MPSTASFVHKALSPAEAAAVSLMSLVFLI